MGGGGYFGAFNQSFLKSQDNARRQGEADLREALTLDAVRQQALEQQDLGGLVGAYQERHRALANQPPPPPGAPPAGMPPPMVSPDAMMGGTVPGVTPPAPPAPGLVPSGPGPAGAPADEGPRRKALLESIDPAMAGRLLRSGAGRTAIKDLAQAEREQDIEETKRLAAPLFTQAAEAAKSGDGLAYYDSVSKAFRILGNHQASGQYLEHAMKLRADTKDREATNADLGRWATANEVYTAAPTPETRQKLLDELNKTTGTGSREIRRQLMTNYFKGLFDQNPHVMRFNRRVAEGHQSAFAEGREVDAEQIYRGAAKADPQGFNAWVFDAMANQKNLPEVVRQKVLRWEKMDVESLSKTDADFAWARARAKHPDLSLNDPRLLEAVDQEFWARSRKKATIEAEARKKVHRDRTPAEIQRDLQGARIEYDRRRRAAQAAVKDGTADEDPELYRQLREEARQAAADRDSLEGELRDLGRLPPKLAPPPVQANPPPQSVTKWGVGSKVYRDAAAAQINRLKAAGLSREQISESMRSAGWR